MMFHDLPIDTNFYIIYKVFVHGFPSHLCLKPPLVSPWRREVGDLSHLLHRWQRDARQTSVHLVRVDRLPPGSLGGLDELFKSD